MATVFSAPVNAFDGNYTRPTNDQICAALQTAENNLVYAPAYLVPFLKKLIDAAQDRFGCKA